MINFIDIKNFKSLKHITIKPSKLNLFFGLNGMGKSSILQFLLLLRQSYIKGLLNEKGLLLQNSELISLGTGKDVFYESAGKDEHMSFEIHTTKEAKYKWSFSFESQSDILPKVNNSDEGFNDFSNIANFSLFNDNFQYLSAEHIGPQKAYQKSDFEVRQHKNIGVKGEYTIHYLSFFGSEEKLTFENLKHPKSSSDILLHQTIAWLSEISPGTKLVIEDIKNTDLVRLGFQFETKSGYTNEFSPVNVGFGILYVLPVIVTLLKAKPDSIVLIENPESHLHPKGQSIIGKLMSLASQNGVQIFCESHSDHIINGVRVAVKEKCLDTNNISINYFSRETQSETHKSKVTPILIDKYGELNHYPEGLLDEWNNLLIKLI
jgi:predicted ATPase